LSNSSLRRAGGSQERKIAGPAESGGFDALITVDQGIPYQQNVGAGRIAVIVLCVSRNRLDNLKKLANGALSALSSISPGQIVRLT
jgi:hypothetical protein